MKKKFLALGHAPVIPGLQGQEDPWSQLISSLAKLVSSRFRMRPCLKKKVSSWVLRGGYTILTSGLYTHMHISHSRTCTQHCFKILTKWSLSPVWWYMSIIPAIQEVEEGESWMEASLGIRFLFQKQYQIRTNKQEKHEVFIRWMPINFLRLLSKSFCIEQPP